MIHDATLERLRASIDAADAARARASLRQAFAIGLAFGVLFAVIVGLLGSLAQ